MKEAKEGRQEGSEGRHKRSQGRKEVRKEARKEARRDFRDKKERGRRGSNYKDIVYLTRRVLSLLSHSVGWCIAFLSTSASILLLNSFNRNS